MKIYRITAGMLIFSALMSTAGCKNVPPEEGGSSGEIITEAPDPTDTPQDSNTDTSASPTEYILLENSVTEYSVVRSEQADMAEKKSAGKVYDRLCELTGSKDVIYWDDFVYPQRPMREKEILVGETNREESKMLYGEIEKADGYCFMIKEINGKIAVGGSNAQMLDRAVDFFLAEFFGTQKDKVTLEAGYCFTSDIIRQDEPCGLISASDKDMIATGKELMSLPRDGDFNVAQGGCTDGKYFYLILENQKIEGGTHNNTSHYGKIYKVDVNTLMVVKTSEPLPIDHGNDCTYNPVLGQIVVSHNAPNRTYLSFIDAETLTLVKTVKNLPLKMYAVAYCESRKAYAIGISDGFNYTSFSEDLKFSRVYSGRQTGYIKQGFDADSKYVYMLQYKKNCIVVHDWEGNYIKMIELVGFSNEPEALFHIGGELYLYSYNGGSVRGGSIYKLTLSEK